MVVLAVGVCTKAGRALLARQFVEMNRVRIEGLLAAFPKLMGSGKQHTFVETENVRYVYQPMEDLYMLLITNKSSNILEDLDTLHLVAKLVPEYCRNATEADINAHKFELVAAIDEVITLGYKEKISLGQIKTFMEMESHEERIFEMVRKNREREAREESKRRIAEMEREKKEMKLLGIAGGGSRTGISSHSYVPSDTTSSSPGPSSGGFAASSQPERSSAAAAPPAKTVGMQLGAKKGKAADLMQSLINDGEYVPETTAATSTARGSGAAAAAAPTIPVEPVHVTFKETVTMTAEKDGGLQSLEIKGDLLLVITGADNGKVRIVMEGVDTAGYKFLTHPHIDKKLYSAESTLGLKDATKGFPPGNPLEVLKYRFQTSDEAAVPLTVSCWPSPTEVNIEYTLNTDALPAGTVLRNVVIAIPIPGGTEPKVNQVDGGSTKFTRDSVLEWELPIIDKDNANGSISFAGDNSPEAGYFPVEVRFQSDSTFTPLKVAKITSSTDPAAPVRYSQQTQVAAASYRVVHAA